MAVDAHPSVLRFIDERQDDSDKFVTKDGWRLGEGVLSHMSGDIMKLFDVKLFTRDDWFNYLVSMGMDVHANVPRCLLDIWANTYGDSRITTELALHYVYRKLKSKHSALIPPKDYSSADFNSYINHFSVNNLGFCDNKVCNYLLESAWKGTITQAEELILYDETENPVNKLGNAEPPKFGIPTLEEVAKRLVLDDCPPVRVVVYQDDISISFDKDREISVVDVSE